MIHEEVRVIQPDRGIGNKCMFRLPTLGFTLNEDVNAIVLPYLKPTETRT